MSQNVNSDISNNPPIGLPGIGVKCTQTIVFLLVDCILIFGHEHINVHACTPCMINKVFKVSHFGGTRKLTTQSKEILKQ